MSKENKADKPSTMIGWNEILTNNRQGTLDFYTKLLGWKVQEIPMSPDQTYPMFKIGDEMVGGLAEHPEGSDAPNMWLSYISVDDLDATIAKAKELGATITKERVDIPMGSFATISDPQGATIAFWQEAAGDAT